jgi:hypothetical protein
MVALPFLILVLGPYISIVLLALFVIKRVTGAVLGWGVWTPAVSMPLLWTALAYFDGRKTFTNAIFEPIILAVVVVVMAIVYAWSFKMGVHWHPYQKAALCLLGVGIVLVVWFAVPNIQD